MRAATIATLSVLGVLSVFAPTSAAEPDSKSQPASASRPATAPHVDTPTKSRFVTSHFLLFVGALLSSAFASTVGATVAKSGSPDGAPGCIIRIGGGVLGSLCGLATLVWGFGRYIGDPMGLGLAVVALLVAAALVAIAKRSAEELLPLAFAAMVLAPALTYFLWKLPWAQA